MSESAPHIRCDLPPLEGRPTQRRSPWSMNSGLALPGNAHDELGGNRPKVILREAMRSPSPLRGAGRGGVVATPRRSFTREQSFPGESLLAGAYAAVSRR